MMNMMPIGRMMMTKRRNKEGGGNVCGKTVNTHTDTHTHTHTTSRETERERERERERIAGQDEILDSGAAVMRRNEQSVCSCRQLVVICRRERLYSYIMLCIIR